jgi:hypothetical protein
MAVLVGLKQREEEGKNGGGDRGLGFEGGAARLIKGRAWRP